MKEVLNILFLCSWYPNPDDPVNGIFIKRHAQALALQHNVTLVFVKAVKIKEPIDIKNKEGRLTEILHFYPKIKHAVPGFSKFIKLKHFRGKYKIALDTLAEKTFDVIHINTIFPAAIPAIYALKKYPNAKLFITEHWSGYYPEDGNYKGLLMRYLTQKIVKRACEVFIVSKKLQEAMQQHGLFNNYACINNVVDVEIFKPCIKAQSNENSCLNILHVSSLVEKEKNISGIIAIAMALKKLGKNFSMTMVGGSLDNIAQYSSTIETNNLGDYVIFAGIKTPPEIAGYMQIADVFLLPSHYEGMPVVVLESLACGLPIIASNVGEIRTILNSDYGVILSENTTQHCVNELMNFNREKFWESEMMFDYINRHFSAEAVCKQITELYNIYLC